MGDMLHEQVMTHRDAPSELRAGPFGETFMENYSIIMNLKTDIQFNLLSNAVLDTIADVQKREEHSAQSIIVATDKPKKMMGFFNIHQAAAVTTEASDDEDNYPNLTQAVHVC